MESVDHHSRLPKTPLGKYFASALIIGMLFTASCRKRDTPGAVAKGNDSLVQYIYTVNRAADAPPAGNILVAPFGAPDTPARLMIMDGAGHLLHEKIIAAGAIDFKKWDIHGQVRYTWFEPEPSVFPDAQQGAEVIADADLYELKRVTAVAHGSIMDAGKQGLDSHDFILIDDDHYIAVVYVKQTVSNVPTTIAASGSAYVVNQVIQEVNSGQVVWQWQSADYPEFYATSVVNNNYSNLATAQDYMHLNSLFLDESDGNLICSFRHTDQILKISRTTGEVIWRLGGTNSDFPLTADMRFLRQHNATLTDGGKTLLVFDNGDLTLRPYSRILEFQLNEGSHTVSSFKSFNIPEPLSRIMGSVQKIGSHYFIGGGSGNYVLDIDYITGEKVLELKASVPTYRAYKY